jgi:hypothetical protein
LFRKDIYEEKKYKDAVDYLKRTIILNPDFYFQIFDTISRPFLLAITAVTGGVYIWLIILTAICYFIIVYIVYFGTKRNKMFNYNIIISEVILTRRY